MFSNRHYRWIALAGALAIATISTTYYVLPWIAAAPYPTVLQTGVAHKPRVTKPPLKPIKSDKLEDFVVNRGDSYARPESWEELRQNIEQQTAERASAFFQLSDTRDKPFFGQIPLRLCYREYETESGVRTQLQVWRDFKLINLSLKGGELPEVFVVAAGGAYNAQVAACEAKRVPAVAYPYEQYWAVVFAGRGGSTPAKFILDRATVSSQSTNIRLYQPSRTSSTADVHEYWFFVPLGRLKEGRHSIEVRSANDDALIASTICVLRNATDEEIAMRNETNSRQMAASNLHFEGLRRQEEEYGAALQLRLERLAEFVESANVSPSDRTMLASDVQKLGAAVDWNTDIYSTQRYARRTLAAPTPGKPADIDYVNKVLDYPYTPWKTSDLRVSDAWLYAGPDAVWYTSKAYRKHPELGEAFTASNPTERQEKVRAILRYLAEKSKSHDERPLATIAAGTMDDAIDAAYEVYVNGKERKLTFTSDDDLWAIMVGTSSYLIRQIGTREFRDNRDPGPTREFRVHTSAYIGSADKTGDNKPSPGTLALIPLGNQAGASRVGVLYSCASVCCRQVEDEIGALALVDAQVSDLPRSLFDSGLCYGAYCQIVPKKEEKP